MPESKCQRANAAVTGGGQMANGVGQVLVGSDGRLRQLWRAVLFYAAATWVVFPLLDWPTRRLAALLHVPPGLTAGNIALSEIGTFIVALILTGAFALYE